MSKDEKKIDPLADDTPDEPSATDSTTPPENRSDDRTRRKYRSASGRHSE